MTHFFLGRFAVLLPVCFSLSCASGSARGCIDQGKEVIFSISSEDMEAFETITEISINDKTIFRGVIRPSKAGSYTYIATLTPTNQGVQIRAQSFSAVGDLTLDKKVWIKDRLWIVITRTHETGMNAALEMSVSYEAPLQDCDETLENCLSR